VEIKLGHEAERRSDGEIERSNRQRIRDFFWLDLPATVSLSLLA